MQAFTQLQWVRTAAGRFGVRSSSVLWKRLALHYYRRKLVSNPEYRAFVSTESPKWVTDHWAHPIEQDEILKLHTSSQLFEIRNLLRERLAMDFTSARVLEAAASDAFFLCTLGTSDGIGINILAPCVAHVREQGYRAYQADIEALPFPDKSVDYVLCLETLEHVQNPISALNELSRVCKKKIYVTLPWIPHTRINRKSNRWPPQDSHIFEFSEMDFQKVLTHARVTVDYQARVQVFPEPRNPISQAWLQRFMYRSFFPKLQYYELIPI